MKITILGTGYVGLVTGTIFAQMGNDVICLDIDQTKIDNLKIGISPIYEPGLEEIIIRNSKEGRLNFTTDINEGVNQAEVIFIGVGTPSREDGSVNLDYVSQAAKSIGEALGKLEDQNTYRVIVNKSTVPIGTGDFVTDLIKENYSGEFDVVSNPEFLREGQAVSDALNPDRVVIGLNPANKNNQAKEVMEKLYQPFNCPILFTDVKTAEMIKYASNSFLATSISFINQLALLCEAVGADVKKVAEGMKLDKRIGPNAFLDAGAGYGGSCFPKDVKGIIDIAKQYNVTLPVSIATEETNKIIRHKVIEKINELLPDLNGKNVAIWGLAFKPETDDIREAPALTIIDFLIQEKANIFAFDPVAKEPILKKYPNLKFGNNPYETAKEADLIVLMTQWDEFSALDLNKIKQNMRTPKMVDARNVYGLEKMKDLGFQYQNIGNVR
jgi:UDPglucose 6-dehydrogenase